NKPRIPGSSPHSPGSPSPLSSGASGQQSSSGPSPERASHAGLPRLRPPLPTLVELGQVSATETLRPPGAVPPPPRGIPAVRGPAPRPQAGPVDPAPLSGTEPVPDTAPALRHEPEDIPRTESERADKPPSSEPYLPSALEAPRPFLDVTGGHG